MFLCFFLFGGNFGSPKTQKTPQHIYPGIYITTRMYECVFFAHRRFFLFRQRVFLVLSAPGHAGSPPEHHGPSLGPGRGPWHCSGVSKSQVTTGRHSEHVEPSRPMQTHVQVKKCPTAHMISRILNVVNVVRHYLVMEMCSPAPTCETCDHF